MPVKKIRIDAMLPGIRDRASALRDSDEWKDVMAILQQGLKPAEAVDIRLGPEVLAKAKMKHPHRMFANMIRTKLKTLGLEYEVETRKTFEGPVVYIASAEPPPVVPRKKRH